MSNVDEVLKNDKILDIWKDNFTNNLGKKHIYDSRVKPIQWLKNNRHYRGLECVLVGAGPSLDDNLSLLKDNKNKFFIVSSDAALPSLIDAGITPHLTVVVDPSEKVSEYFTKSTADMFLCAPPTSHPSVFETWKGKIFMYAQEDGSNKYKQGVLNSISHNLGFHTIMNLGFVGYTMFEIAKIFEPKKIMLLGYDFCYHKGLTYCEGTLRSKFGELWKEENDRVYEFLRASDKLVPVEKFNCDTSRLLLLYLHAFDWVVKQYRSIMVNCSHPLWTTVVPFTEFSRYMEEVPHNEILNQTDLWSFYKAKKRRK